MNRRSIFLLFTLISFLCASPAFAQNSPSAHKTAVKKASHRKSSKNPKGISSKKKKSSGKKDSGKVETPKGEPPFEQIQEAAKPPKLRSNVFDTGSVVRRKVLYRSTRFEIEPFFGLTVNDTFNRNLMPGINLNYHITNDIAISLSFAYGAAVWKTDLMSNLLNTFRSEGSDTFDKNSPEKALKPLDFIKMQLFVDLGLAYVPFYGKFSLFGAATVAWDFHLVGGVVLILPKPYNPYNDTNNPNSKSDYSGSPLKAIAPGGLVQAGVRFYLGDFVSLNFDVRNFIYGAAEVANDGNADRSVTDHVFISLGVGFFFPTDVKVSW